MSDEILKRAIAKRQRNETLSREEQRAYDRWKKDATDKQLRDGLARLPKKLYVELSGRQHKILDEQAGRYGLPLLGKEIDVGAVLRRFHDLLRDHGELLSGEQPAGDDPTDWGEEFKKWKALSAKAEFMEACGQLLRKHLIDQGLQNAAALFRSAGERMQHEGHAAAYEILNETINDVQRSFDELLFGQPLLQDEIEQPESS